MSTANSRLVLIYYSIPVAVAGYRELRVVSSWGMINMFWQILEYNIQVFLFQPYIIKYTMCALSRGTPEGSLTRKSTTLSSIRLRARDSDVQSGDSGTSFGAVYTH